MNRWGCSKWLAGLAILIVMSSGCAGYRLGSTDGQRIGGKSVRVDLFQNETLEPRLSEAVATSLRRRIQQDGTLRLNTKGSADLVVAGRIIAYKRTSLSFQPRDVLTPRDMELKLTVHVGVTTAGGGTAILDRDVTSRTIIRSESDLSAAERAAVPLLAEDLSRTIVSLIVDGEW